MTQVQEIQIAIESLSEEDFAQLRQWFADRDWERWDEQIAADSAAGKLDFLIEEAQQEKKKGQLKDL